MPLPTSYDTGTISVSAAGTSVTGSGTNWIAGGIEPGDVFWCAGLSVTVASVESATALTLAFPWPGSAQSGAAYEVRYTPDAQRVLASARELIEDLSNGNLPALSGLTSASDTLPYFTGPGAAGITGLTAFGRSLLSQTGTNGSIPVATGAGTSALRSIVGTVGQSGGIPNGALFETGENPNGSYVRSADGLQVCFSPAISGLDVSTAQGGLYTTGGQPWNYPVPFAASPVVGSGSGNDARIWVTMNTNIVVLNSAVFSVYSAINLTDRTVYLSAIGRWY